jgi:hypothetical protein
MGMKFAITAQAIHGRTQHTNGGARSRPDRAAVLRLWLKPQLGQLCRVLATETPHVNSSRRQRSDGERPSHFRRRRSSRDTRRYGREPPHDRPPKFRGRYDPGRRRPAPSAIVMPTANRRGSQPKLTPVAFMIHGWSTSGENKIAEEVWLKVDRSWRAAWR